MKKTSLLYYAIGFILPAFLGCASASVPDGSGRLKPCPDSPNCVSSLDPRPEHAVAPLTYQGSWVAARDRLARLIEQMQRTDVVEVNERYVRAESRSRIFGFVDDVSFYFDLDQPVIHVRSASRTGYSDLGVNRKRVEMIRRLWNEEMMAK